jgi:nucleoside-diphosphate-sugar epimerase
MQKILVAGGAGYIGSRLVPELLSAGHDVTVVDLLWFGNNLPPSVTVIEKDIFALQKEDLQGFDTVIFLGGLSNDPMAEFSPALNFASNGACPGYLAYISKLAGVKKFIYGSSCSVYGLADTDMVTENERPNTQFPYGISKLSGEQAVLQIADETFPVIALRQGTISGASPRMRFDLLLNTMYMRSVKDRKIVVNNPIIWRPLLAITDAVKAYCHMVEFPFTEPHVFNIASTNITVGDAAQQVKQFFKEKYGLDIEIEERAVPDKRNYRVSNEKVIAHTGIEFAGSVRSILEDLDTHIGFEYDFDHERGYNIEIFKKLPKSFTLE